MTTARQIRLVSKPVGMPAATDFEVTKTPVPELADGQLAVRNRFLSIQPATRLFLDDSVRSLPSFAIGDGIRGDAVGVVVDSRSPEFTAGDVVMHPLGWRDFAVGDDKLFRKLAARPDDDDLPSWLSSGLVAYVGLRRIAELEPGETVWVSSAAGSVGSLAGQIGRLAGAGRVVGSAGTSEKVRHLTEDLGFDAAFDYHDGPIVDRLAEAAPDGIDVYFDNVGGDHLEAALEVLNPHGRVVLCGAMSRQGTDEVPPGPRNLLNAIAKRITLRGFTVSEHLDVIPSYTEDVARWRAEGKLTFRQNLVPGLENTPQVFVDILRGAYTGQVIVEV